MMADVIMGDRDLSLACCFYLPGKFRLKVGLRSLKADSCPRTVRHQDLLFTRVITEAADVAVIARGIWTLRRLPPSSLSWSAAIASFAPLCISTNPNPHNRPVSRFLIRLTCSTMP